MVSAASAVSSVSAVSAASVVSVASVVSSVVYAVLSALLPQATKESVIAATANKAVNFFITSSFLSHFSKIGITPSGVIPFDNMTLFNNMVAL